MPRPLADPPAIEREVVRLQDGRRLTFYPFRGDPGPEAAVPVTPPTAPTTTSTPTPVAAPERREP